MAKDYKVQITLNAIDNASKMIGKIDDAIDRNKQTIQGLGVAFTAVGASITAALGLSVKAAMAQEEANIFLADSMKRAGSYTEEAYNANLNYASSLQTMTKFSDDQIITAQTMMIDFGVQQSMLEKVTMATLDLAEAKKMDLRSAADLVAKSIGSDTNALARYGVELDGAAKSTERATAFIEGIAGLMGGKATTAANTFAGQTVMAKNAIEDFMESIGFALMPALQSLVGVIQKITEMVVKFQNENKILFNITVKITAAFGGLSLAFGSMLLILPTLVTSIGYVTTAVKVLFAIITAHPLVALATAIAAATIAGLALADSYITQKTAAVNSGKTIIDRIALLKKERDEIMQHLASSKISTEQRTKLEEQAGMRIKAILMLQKDEAKRLDMERTAAAKAEADKRTAAATAAAEAAKRAEMEKLRQEQETYAYKQNLMQQQRVYDQAYLDYQISIGQAFIDDKRMKLDEELLLIQEQLAAQTILFGENSTQVLGIKAQELELKKQLYELEKNTFAGVLNEMQNKQTNWAIEFKKSMESLTSSLSAGFVFFLEGMEKGWVSFADFATKVGETFKSAIIKQFADLAAGWVTQHVIMGGATLAWKAIEITAAAAVAAARAAISAFKVIPFPFNFAAAAAAAVGAYALIKSYLATGARGFEGGLAMVGERGPELVNLPKGSDVLNNPETRNMLSFGTGNNGGSKNVFNINLSGNFYGTPEENADAVANILFKKLQLQGIV